MQFDKIAQLLLPVNLRKSTFLAWLKVLTMPLQMLYNTFQGYMASARQQLSYNGQVIFMRKLLRDRFNPGGTLINITDGLDTQIYIGYKIEGDYQYFKLKTVIGDELLMGQLTAYDLDYEIKVEVNEALSPLPSEQSVKNLLMRYKLAGKRIYVDYKPIIP